MSDNLIIRSTSFICIARILIFSFPISTIFGDTQGDCDLSRRHNNHSILFVEMILSSQNSKTSYWKCALVIRSIYIFPPLLSCRWHGSLWPSYITFVLRSNPQIKNLHLFKSSSIRWNHLIQISSIIVRKGDLNSVYQEHRQNKDTAMSSAPYRYKFLMQD